MRERVNIEYERMRSSRTCPKRPQMGRTRTEIVELTSYQEDMRGKPSGKKPLERPRLRWRDNIGDDVKVLRLLDSKEVALDRDR